MIKKMHLIPHNSDPTKALIAPCDAPEEVIPIRLTDSQADVPEGEIPLGSIYRHPDGEHVVVDTHAQDDDTHAGPPRVNNRKFLDGWERTFGKTSEPLN